MQTLLKFIAELSKQVKFLKDGMNRMKQSITQRDMQISDLKSSHQLVSFILTA